MKYLIPLILLFPSLVFAVVDSKATNASSKADGNNGRIQALEAEDIILHNRIDTIQLTPGPKGDKGDQGIQGVQGVAGTEGIHGTNGVDGINGTDGAKGDTGAQGIQGIQGVAGPAGPTGLSGPQGIQGETGQQGEPGPEGAGRIINLAIDPLQFPGLSAQDFGPMFPDATLNTAVIEVEGVCGGPVVIINGPALETQVVVTSTTPHDDQSGLSMELPIVIETLPNDELCHVQLTQYFDTYFPGDNRSLSIVVFDVSGLEAFRWNLYLFAPDGYVPGLEGGNRFTFVQTQPPVGVPGSARGVAIDRDPQRFPTNTSYNSTTDKLVEIAGINGLYPAVVTRDDRTLTLVYDYTEGNGMWEWMKGVAEQGTTLTAKREVSVITVDDNLYEIDRINYYGCFPKKYEHFTGFVQDIQTKERLILTCDYSAAVLP